MRTALSARGTDGRRLTPRLRRRAGLAVAVAAIVLGSAAAVVGPDLLWGRRSSPVAPPVAPGPPVMTRTAPEVVLGRNEVELDSGLTAPDVEASPPAAPTEPAPAAPVPEPAASPQPEVVGSGVPDEEPYSQAEPELTPAPPARTAAAPSVMSTPGPVVSPPVSVVSPPVPVVSPAPPAVSPSAPEGIPPASERVGPPHQERPATVGSTNRQPAAEEAPPVVQVADPAPGPVPESPPAANPQTPPRRPDPRAVEPAGTAPAVVPPPPIAIPDVRPPPRPDPRAIEPAPGQAAASVTDAPSDRLVPSPDAITPAKSWPTPDAITPAALPDPVISLPAGPPVVVPPVR